MGAIFEFSSSLARSAGWTVWSLFHGSESACRVVEVMRSMEPAASIKKASQNSWRIWLSLTVTGLRERAAVLDSNFVLQQPIANHGLAGAAREKRSGFSKPSQ